MTDIVLTETVTVSTRDATDEERHLARRYNLLVDKCLTWAGRQMEYGTYSTKLALTKSVLTSASRLASLDTKTQTEQHRIAFQQLLANMTEINATVTPALGTVIDQDEESGDP